MSPGTRRPDTGAGWCWRITLCAVLALAGCASGVSPAAPARLTEESPYVARGRQAMVAAADPRASAAGLRMIQAGGNAVDALAACSFAISVVRPQSTGIGGGGFAVLHLRDAGPGGGDFAVDFRERAPAAARREMFLEPGVAADASLVGPLAVGVPGTVAGVLTLHERYGRLPRAEVLAPAIALAEEGFAVSPELAGALEAMAPLLARSAASAEVFLPGGNPPKAGELLRQQDLARTLRAIAAEGQDAFYEGPIAAAIAAEVQRLGGIMSAEDLKHYRVIERPVVRGRYRGFDIVTMPPPSSGLLLIEMMNMLAAAGPGAGEASPAERLHLLAEVMRRAYQDRALHLGDPDFVPVPVDRLRSAAYAAERMRDFEAERATPQPGPVDARIRVTSTTHISIIDPAGNAVAATESVNYTFGSGIVVPGTGVLLNDTMDDFATRPGVPNAYGLVGSDANAVAAGKTPLSSMSPTIVLHGGEPRLVVGSPGGSLIITAVLQTILNVLDRGMRLPEAVAAPRIHHQSIPNWINCEPGALSASERAALERRGHAVHELARMGDVQAVMRVSAGEVVGVSDPRGEGRPAGF